MIFRHHIRKPAVPSSSQCVARPGAAEKPRRDVLATRHKSLGPILLACSLLGGCGAQTSGTETGNPPVVTETALHLKRSAGVLYVEGNEGAVQPEAQLTLTNSTAGESARAQADKKGSFALEIPAKAGDTVELSVEVEGETTTLDLSEAAASAVESEAPPGNSPTAQPSASPTPTQCGPTLCEAGLSCCSEACGSCSDAMGNCVPNALDCSENGGLEAMRSLCSDASGSSNPVSVSQLAGRWIACPSDQALQWGDLVSEPTAALDIPSDGTRLFRLVEQDGQLIAAPEDQEFGTIEEAGQINGTTELDLYLGVDPSAAPRNSVLTYVAESPRRLILIGIASGGATSSVQQTFVLDPSVDVDLLHAAAP